MSKLYIYKYSYAYLIYIYICSVYKFNVHISIFVSEHMLEQRQQAFRHKVAWEHLAMVASKNSHFACRPVWKHRGWHHKMSFLDINSGTLHPITYCLVYQLSLSYFGAVSMWKCLAGERKKKKKRSERRLS